MLWSAASADQHRARFGAGYRRWQDLRAKRDALEDLEDEARGRAWNRAPEVYAGPEPVPDPDVKRLGRMLSETIEQARDPTSPVSILQDLLDRYDAYWQERGRWFDRQPKIDTADSDWLEAKRIQAERDALRGKAARLRQRLLRVPTTSPQGLMIKLSLAIEVRSLDEMAKHLKRPRYYGVDDYDLGTELVPSLLADFQAMVGAQPTA